MPIKKLTTPGKRVTLAREFSFDEAGVLNGSALLSNVEGVARNMAYTVGSQFRGKDNPQGAIDFTIDPHLSKLFKARLTFEFEGPAEFLGVEGAEDIELSYEVVVPEEKPKPEPEPKK